MMRRNTVLAATLAALGTTATALVSCASPGGGWTGGPVSPAPVRVSVNPSALPIGDAVATGIVVGTKEIVLYLWDSRKHPYLVAAWRDTGTGEVGEDSPVPSSVPDLAVSADGAGSVFGLDQLVPGDGTVIEFGAVRGPVARVVSQPPDGVAVPARFVRWSADPGVVIFLLRRPGAPVPPNRTVGNGTEPYELQRYPLVSAYDAAGRTLASARIRPPAFLPRNDG